jgi:hypothetical protein
MKGIHRRKHILVLGTAAGGSFRSVSRLICYKYTKTAGKPIEIQIMIIQLNHLPNTRG